MFQLNIFLSASAVLVQQTHDKPNKTQLRTPHNNEFYLLQIKESTSKPFNRAIHYTGRLPESQQAIHAGRLYVQWLKYKTWFHRAYEPDLAVPWTL